MTASDPHHRGPTRRPVPLTGYAAILPHLSIAQIQPDFKGQKGMTVFMTSDGIEIFC